MTTDVAGMVIPDSPMASAAVELMRVTVSELLFAHAMRVYLFGALIAQDRQQCVDTECLYIGALFHAFGLADTFKYSPLRFEVDGANAASALMQRFGAREDAVTQVWDAILLHMTPGLAEHKSPLAAALAAGVELDLLGRHFERIGPVQRRWVLAAYPREHSFKLKMIDVFGNALIHRPASTFGTVAADVLERVDPTFNRSNFCGLILGSRWQD